jgi:hypothetical protein
MSVDDGAGKASLFQRCGQVTQPKWSQHRRLIEPRSARVRIHENNFDSSFHNCQRANLSANLFGGRSTNWAPQVLFISGAFKKPIVRISFSQSYGRQGVGQPFSIYRFGFDAYTYPGLSCNKAILLNANLLPGQGVCVPIISDCRINSIIVKSRSSAMKFKIGRET